MAKAGIPSDVMNQIRGFPFLETEEEVGSFVEFGENSEHKIVRGMHFTVYRDSGLPDY